MKNATILEITSFKVNERVTEETLKTAAEKMQKEFLAKAEGFISRTITRESDGTWRDVIFWKDKHSFDKTAKEAMNSEAAGPFMSCIDFNSVVMKTVEIKAHYP